MCVEVVLQLSKTKSTKLFMLKFTNTIWVCLVFEV